jgi:hypothetical protein
VEGGLLIDLPATRAEVQTLVDTKVQESLHLDYKASQGLVGPNKHGEIAKDVSAFADSDGGLIIYGVTEKDHIPIGIDSGVNHRRYSREWLEQVIRNNITPRIEDLRIASIFLSADTSLYALQIPKSYRAPHQEMTTKRYYKRYNFDSVPMEDYEINDIRGRRRIISPLINIDADIKHGVVIYLRVMNIGNIPALDVSFEFSEPLIWRDGREPLLLTRGTKYWPPGKTLHFRYHAFQELVSKDSKVPAEFNVIVSYRHPNIGQRISDIFHIDILDYMNSSVIESEIYHHTQTVKDVFQQLIAEVAKLNQHIEIMSAISGATGLNLSISTMKNLKHIISRDQPLEKIDPKFRDYTVFQEVLGINIEMAFSLQDFFNHREHGQRLTDIQGMTPELAARIHQYFIVEPEADEPTAGRAN